MNQQNTTFPPRIQCTMSGDGHQNKRRFAYFQKIRSKNSFLERRRKKKKLRKDCIMNDFQTALLILLQPSPSPRHRQKILSHSSFFWKHNEQRFQILVTFVKRHNELRYNKIGQKKYNSPQMRKRKNTNIVIWYTQHISISYSAK